MCIEEILEKYYKNELNTRKVLEFLELKTKIKKRFPLIDYDLYKELLEYILKKCLDNYDFKEDFIKYIFKEIDIVLLEANRQEELKVANNYLLNVFIYDTKEVKIIIKEINDFITFLMCNNIVVNSAFLESLFIENKNIFNSIKDIFQKNNITLDYINKISSDDNVLNFYEIIFDLLNLNSDYDYEESSLKTKNILKHDLSTKEEIEELFKRYQDGDLDARQEILSKNYRLVGDIANKFYYKLHSFTYDDLFQEGIRGLIKAAEKFDSNKGYRFTTYATFWIAEYIRRSIINYDKMIRISEKSSNMGKEISETKRILETELGREATIEEIAKELNTDSNTILNYMNISYGVESLNQPVINEDYDELEKIIPSDYDLENEIIITDRDRIVYETIKTLTEREQQVILMRAGIGYNRSYTLEEISKIFDLSHERIRQLEFEIGVKLNRKGLLNYDTNGYKLSINTKKLKLNDYFLGISTVKLIRVINTIPEEYRKIINHYYNGNLQLIELYKINDIFYEEVIPFIFNILYEQTPTGKINPLINHFSGIDLKTLQSYINEYKLSLIYKRYGENLNELKPLSKREYKKLYTKEIPYLYNYYMIKKKSSIAFNVPLKAKYNYLSLNELNDCINELKEKDRNIVYKIYGEQLDLFNYEYYNKKVIDALDSKISKYLDCKKRNNYRQKSNGKVIIVSKAKSFREKYPQYDVTILKDIINNMPKYKNIIYLRYGEFLNEQNEINVYDRKLLLEGLKSFEENLGKFKNNELLLKRSSLLEIYYMFTKDELKGYIEILDLESQKIIYDVYSLNLNKTNYCLYEDLEKFNKAMIKLNSILMPIINKLNEQEKQQAMTLKRIKPITY
ncbi:MAG: sigma-70 family RNA polymerase sigma factor [Firmicutes bacterium]|nr:sigma-70 family RNA polymerase sigma factor [Bacillota bacterium]